MTQEFSKMESVKAGIDWNELARQAYTTYSISTGNKNFLGKQMPYFDDLSAEQIDTWGIAARRAIFVYKEQLEIIDIKSRMP
jgi:hypothetical protein